jgi:hypothetical protein
MRRYVPRARTLCGITNALWPPAFRYLREPILKTVTVVLVVLLLLQYAVNMVVTSRYKVSGHHNDAHTATSISRYLCCGNMTNSTHIDSTPAPSVRPAVQPHRTITTQHNSNSSRHLLSQSALFNASVHPSKPSLPFSVSSTTTSYSSAPDPPPSTLIPFRVKVFRHRVKLDDQQLALLRNKSKSDSKNVPSVGGSFV